MSCTYYAVVALSLQVQFIADADWGVLVVMDSCQFFQLPIGYCAAVQRVGASLTVMNCALHPLSAQQHNIQLEAERTDNCP